MKTCRKCNTTKDLSEFYKQKAMLDGHLNICKSCVKQRVNAHREANLEAARAYDKLRSKLPHRVEARKRYEKTEAGQQARKVAKENYRMRYPMKYAAHIILNNALRSGSVAKQEECSICASTHKVEAHHDDYTKPLAIRWLCESCHKEWHRHNKPIVG